MSEILQLSKGLQGVIEREGLVPGDKPGVWVKPGHGIDMHKITFDAIPIKPVQPKPEPPPPSVGHDGTDSTGVFALRRREKLKDRMSRILNADRKAIGRQIQLEDEAGRLVTEMSEDSGLRGQIEGVVRRLPTEERAFVARLLRERGDPAKQILQNVDAVRRADNKKEGLYTSGYTPIGSGFGDSMVVTGEGVQIFVAGTGSGDSDTTPDAAFPFDAVVSGRLKFEVVGRSESDRRASKRRWGVFPETVRATDTVTGKTYELRGVRDPDDVLNNLLQTAQTITAGEQAALNTMQLLRDHPEMLE